MRVDDHVDQPQVITLLLGVSPIQGEERIKREKKTSKLTVSKTAVSKAWGSLNVT